MLNLLKEFNRFVEKVPEKPMLESSKRVYSFLEVDNISNYIATQIKDKEADIVPLYIENDIFITPAVLAILKAGKIPLPLSIDLDYYTALENILEVEYDFVLTDKENIENTIFISDELYDCRNNFEYIDQSDDKGICYIVSTSGTTGIPKKVLIKETALLHVLKQYISITNFVETSKFLNTSPYTFDASLFGIFLPMITGGCYVCFDKPRQKSHDKIIDTGKLISEKKVTHTFLVPSYAEAVLTINSKDKLKKLKNVTIGGEYFTSYLKNLCREKLANTTQVLNIYGPSETTIFAIYHEVNLSSVEEIPLGKPLKGVYLNYDKENELLIGGKTLSAGYLNTSLNKDKFIWIEDKEYYVTGDKVIRSKFGLLYYRGRKDSQVKVNGIRIELDGIDSTLMKSNFIEKSITIFENKKIHCFILKKEAADEENILKYATQHFQKNYNIKFHFIDTIPLTNHQKVNKKALISSLGLERKYQENFEADSMKNCIVAILSEEFFENDINDLDSISFILFCSRIEEVFSIKIDDSDMNLIRNVDRLIEYIYHEKNSKKQELVINNQNNSELDIINVKELLKPQHTKLEELFDTLYLQKNYLDKKYYEVLYFDLPMIQTNKNKNISSLKDIIKVLVSKIDIMKIVVTKTNGKILFKKIPEYEPIIYTSEKFINIEILTDYMFSNDSVPLFFINYNCKENKTRFYVAHLVIDQFRMNQLARIVSDIYYDGKVPMELEEKYSYKRYINYVKEKNKSYNLKMIKSILPVSFKLSNTSRDKKNIQYLCFNVESLLTSDDFSILTAYIVGKIVMEDSKIARVTGSIISNIRNYDDYDAAFTIGDVHTTFPFQLEHGDSIELFSKRAFKVLSEYKKGLNIRDILFENYPYFTPEQLFFKEQWEEMNFSVNFIGEVKDVKETMKKFKIENYGKKYLISFTSKGRLYIYISGGYVCKNEYTIDKYKVSVFNEILGSEKNGNYCD
ncbi:non-ribosomal peptide synthetase [Enterococcus sp. BWB1-3]|uniref:non-ribosomal peptide synthetase n=1 Tax=Enterococcus sp. BWB1-3 TaxID=2787713 RepID=UPI001920A356|nr:AMP-binding protein [Enterococcus sp. BWB1-3]MBL1228439.1 non-ribosomal peptide synthetase [Enterococcus sp. BWB1-3]